jgi:2-dehydropantoate 2-reductase
MNSSRTRTQKSSWRRFSKRSSRSPKAQGIAIDYKERWAAINGVLENAVGSKASMLQDVEASRKTEIEVINGAIAEAGRLTRIPTPVNEIVVAMISALQAKYLAPKAV